jgi:hypothetical protein
LFLGFSSASQQSPYVRMNIICAHERHRILLHRVNISEANSTARSDKREALHSDKFSV